MATVVKNKELSKWPQLLDFMKKLTLKY